MEPWKTRLLVAGGVIGAVSGLLAAFLMVKKAEAENSQPQLAPSDGVKVGVSLLGIIKLISDLGSPK